MERVFDHICLLGEGPVWNVARRQLLWTDVDNKTIWVYDPATGSADRFWQGDHEVGGFAFTRAGGIVMCTDTGVYILDPARVGELHAAPRLLYRVEFGPGEVFNDITVDPRGRVFAGTKVGFRPESRVFRIERGKEPVVVLEGLQCSNGMTFSMDEKSFFCTDTGARTVSRYDYCAATGEIANPRVFFQGTAAQGYPDGLTIDTEDHIWQAFWGGSMVRRIDPDGKIVAEIPVPARQPSSVMFGGDDLGDLYITSACQDAADLATGTAANGDFLGGPLYRHRTPSTGRPEWLADLDG
jgi:D-xylonolactonase